MVKVAVAPSWSAPSDKVIPVAPPVIRLTPLSPGKSRAGGVLVDEPSHETV